MFAERRFAFVDVETTGSSPQQARMTEVAVIFVDPAGAPDTWHLEEWSTLIDPGCAIPPEIQFLTGITPQMVRGAPPFASIAAELHERLAGAVLVAHNARFDYAFLKAEFARAGLAYTAKTLCTVRLSRLLDPDRSPHSLDAIIARHRLPAEGRHRALGDARVLCAFLRKVWSSHGPEAVIAAVRRLLRHPSLPSHLPADTLEQIPKAPGVYQFYGLNDHPLYIGKSICLRERVASHFVADHRQERGVRLASEVRRIEWARTVGDLGARLLEARWIRERLPAHNIALRRRLAEVVIEPWDPAQAQVPRIRKVSDCNAQALAGHAGPFASRASARARLLELAGEHGLCAKVLGLERGPADAPCFNRQLGRCRGACTGAETKADMARRLADVLAPLTIPPWTERPIVLQETVPTDTPASPDHVADAWHVFDQWRYLGCAADRAGAAQLAESGVPPAFDSMAYRLLRQALEQLPPGVIQHRLEPGVDVVQPSVPDYPIGGPG